MDFFRGKYHFVFFTCLLFAVSSLAQAQNTFSKVYDLELGNNNVQRTLIVETEDFIVATAHSGDAGVLSALTRFDFDGIIVDQNSYSDFVINRSRSIIQTDNGIELAGHRWSLDENFSRGLQLIKVNDEFEFVDQDLLYYEKERNVNGPGVVDLNGNLKVVYGSFVQLTSGNDGGAYVALMDKETDSIQAEVIFRAIDGDPYGQFDMYDLQEAKAKDGMLFLAEADPPGAGPGTGSKLEIIKFNWDGEIIRRITSEEYLNNFVLAQDDTGDIYFYNRRIPFRLDTILPFADRFGGIVKLNADLDSVLWSFTIQDKDGIIENRGHTIFGITQVQDGNMLACGRVGLDVDNTNEVIGFVCKFTPEGEVLWVREYGIPISKEYLDLSLIGVLGDSFLRDCKELEDGRLLCMGGNLYAKPEISFYQELWILMLDEEGCLEPGCEATTIFTSTTQPLSLQQQGMLFPNPVNETLNIKEVTFEKYKIYDLQGRLIQSGPYSSQIKLNNKFTVGMYILQLKEKGHLKSVLRFVKE